MRKVVAGIFVTSLFFCAVEGVTMSIAPPSVYLQYTGVGQMAQTTFLCAGITSSDVSTTFDRVISLTMSRSTRRQIPGQTPTIIAKIEPALPSNVTLSATRFGATVEGPVNNPYPMSEGDEIEFTCNGNIGSSTRLQFEWWITGNMGLIKFRPNIQPNAVETHGEATQGSTACSYSRKTTMRYNITATDKNRGSLTFMCFAQVNPPSPAQSYPQNSTAFYITIAEGGNDGGEMGTSEVVIAHAEGGNDGGEMGTSEVVIAHDGPYFNTAVDNKAMLAAIAGTMGAVTVTLLVVEI